MDSQKGALFNIVIAVVIFGIIFGVMSLFVPGIWEKITKGMGQTVDDAFSSTATTPGP